MGYKEIDIKVPVFFPETELKTQIARKTRLIHFNHHIIRKSLDARNKKRICWLYRIGIQTDELKTGHLPDQPILTPVYKKQDKHVVIAGSGPAGLFSALFLLLSGYKVTLLERGNRVEERKEAVRTFEKKGIFNPNNNYSFGEGGAGTFSDGKLTSRTKNISLERNFIFKYLIEAGAPEEISYLAHPHLGTDNLFLITQNLRQKLLNMGCDIYYNCRLEGLIHNTNKISEVVTSKGTLPADIVLVAAGHSAYDTYRMLINKRVAFRTKNFALGFRAEHRQEIINHAQWGMPQLPGVKAAEYRLATETSGEIPVYSFCMCPGGIIVPATPYAHTNIVNGMSYYKRNSGWANAAIVAGISLEKILAKPVTATEAIEWLEMLEMSFLVKAQKYAAYASTISGFISNKPFSDLPKSTYPFPLVQADFRELLPPFLIPPLIEGLIHFSRKLKGYETGIIVGLESKTSSPVQAIRDRYKMNATFDNLYIVGEGSGWAGGIISSAADGLKACSQIIH